MNQDFTSYIKGGWLLRKAWKIYEQSYKVIKERAEKKHNSCTNECTAATPSDVSVSPETSSIPSMCSDAMSDPDLTLLSGLGTGRLLGSVSFGYGLFQLCISMVPPKLLKVIEFLGFEGDRDTGLEALEYSSQTDDMKAPLAT